MAMKKRVARKQWAHISVLCHRYHHSNETRMVYIYMIRGYQLILLLAMILLPSHKSILTSMFVSCYTFWGAHVFHLLHYLHTLFPPTHTHPCLRIHIHTYVNTRRYCSCCFRIYATRTRYFLHWSIVVSWCSFCSYCVLVDILLETASSLRTN